MEASSGDYWLGRGPHATPDEGRCAMEWVSHLAGEPHNDRPACVSPALRSFCVALNDGLGNRERQRMRPYLTRTIGTVEDGLDTARGWMALDWLVRAYLPAWLDLAGVGHGLTALAPINGDGALAAALRELDVAGREARAVCAAARRTSPLARGLSPLTERSARRAARACGRPAVWVVVRIAPGAEAGQSASDATRAAAADAAAAAARRGTIEATVHRLHESAFALLDRLLPTQPWSRIKMHGTPHVGSWPTFLAS
jgi:hypothetical protein